MNVKITEFLIFLAAVVLCLVVFMLMISGCSRFISVVPYEIECNKAHDKLVDLECIDLLIVPGPDEIPFTDDDPPWATYCKTVNDSGIISIDTTCIMSAANCKQVEACFD